MPALLDTLDRFNYTATSIRSLARSQPHRSEPGPFTGAILHLTPHDLLRDADDSEYGVFTFTRDPLYTPHDAVTMQGKVGRREFRGATPLRGKRVAGAGTNKTEEPEVYLEAALKYLDRFHTVKPMPHARAHLESLIDRLNHTRDNLERLQNSLEEATHNERTSPNTLTAEEERRIGELKSRVLQLRKRKEALVSKLPTKSKLPLRGAKPGSRVAQERPKSVTPSSTFELPSPVVSIPTSHVSHSKSKPKPRPIPSSQGRCRSPGPPAGKSIPRGDAKHTSSVHHEDHDESESLFWSGGKPPRLGLENTGPSGSLLDEELDMSGMEALMSPSIPSSSRASRTPEPLVTAGQVSSLAQNANAADNPDEKEDDGDSDSGEPTVVVSKIARPPPVLTPPSPPPSRSISQASVPEPQTPVQNENTATVPPSTKTKVRRVRITSEVERACAKIWSTIPDLLLPGNNFSSPSRKPPNAKDTLIVLQTISAQSLSDPSSNSVPSPSTRSTLSSFLGIDTLAPLGGSPHQIMTAHVLLSLLTAPNHAMPLTTLKALLASKTAVPSPGPDAGREAKQTAAAMGASAAQAGTRALYGCVAKKLVKIDRGGGEQIVKFE